MVKPKPYEGCKRSIWGYVHSNDRSLSVGNRANQPLLKFMLARTKVLLQDNSNTYEVRNTNEERGNMCAGFSLDTNATKPSSNKRLLKAELLY